MPSKEMGQLSNAMSFNKEEKQKIIREYRRLKGKYRTDAGELNYLMQMFNRAAGETVYSPETLCSGCAQQIMKFWKNIIPKWIEE